MGKHAMIQYQLYRELKNQEARFAGNFREKSRQKFVIHPKLPGTTLTGSGDVN